MAMEQEIKLTLPAAQVDAAKQWFVTRSGAQGRAIRLENRYFDTPSLALASAKAAIRLRRTPDAWLQTYKTVGEAKNGLHSRHEWEMPVKGDALEIDTLLAQCDDAAARDALQAAAPQLVELFRTDFTRTLWLVEHDGAQIEAAVDQGEVTATVDEQTRRAPILEIELELKSGDEAALHTLAKALGEQIPGLAPDDISKAQRGYRLRAQR